MQTGVGDVLGSWFAPSSRTENWADLKEDKNHKSGPGFSGDFRALGAHGGPREPRERPRLEKEWRLHQTSAPQTNYESHSWALSVFGTDRNKFKFICFVFWPLKVRPEK